MSVASDGSEGNGNSFAPSISADGRFVAFASSAHVLVPGDSNGFFDIFVHDRQTGATQRVSVDSGGSQADAGSFETAISADGRFVAFSSLASNLVLGDSNGLVDIFVHDRQMGVTQRASVDSAGVQGNSSSLEPAISADGRFVAFSSFATNLAVGDEDGTLEVLVHDRQTGATQMVSVDSNGDKGNAASFNPTISADGRLISFLSLSDNLVPNDTNGAADVFTHDRQTGTTQRVSVDSGGSQANHASFNPAISADGLFVAFASHASSLVARDTNKALDVFVHDRLGTAADVGIASGGFRTKLHIDLSRCVLEADTTPGFCDRDVVIRVKNFGDVPAAVDFELTSDLSGAAPGALCQGSSPVLAPGETRLMDGCAVTYTEAGSYTLTLTTSLTQGTDVDPTNNSHAKTVAVI